MRSPRGTRVSKEPSPSRVPTMMLMSYYDLLMPARRSCFQAAVDGSHTRRVPAAGLRRAKPAEVQPRCKSEWSAPAQRSSAQTAGRTPRPPPRSPAPGRTAGSRRTSDRTRPRAAHATRPATAQQGRVRATLITYMSSNHRNTGRLTDSHMINVHVAPRGFATYGAAVHKDVVVTEHANQG